MDDRQKQILTLEQDASRLVDELGALKREVSSYRTATGELEKARSVLAGFLEQTQTLTQQTHKLIGTINEIGSAKIFAQLEAIQMALASLTETVNSIGSAKISQQLEAIQMALAENAKSEAKRNLLLVIGLVLVVVLQIVMLIMLRTGR